MTKHSSVIVAILAISTIALAGYIFVATKPSGSPQSSSEEIALPPGADATGRAVFSITDAAASMDQFSDIILTIDKAEAYHISKGWVSVADASKPYHLLTLKASGEWQLLADAPLSTGTYTQMRVHIKEVTVIERGGEKKKAVLPSNDLAFPVVFLVKKDATASVLLDVLADKSLHVAESGAYVFIPVVTVESRTDADVMVASNGSVSVTGGNMETNALIGMKLDGTTDVNFILDPNARLKL